MKEKDQFRREELLERLQDYLAHNPSEEVVWRGLSSPDPFVRNSLLEVGRRWGEEALPLLERLFQTENPHLRKLVLDLASFVPASGVIGLFRRALSDPDPNIRMTAVEYLGERGDEASFSLIAELLTREEEPMLKATIFETLAELCKGQAETSKIIEEHRENLDPLLYRPFLKLVAACGEKEDLFWLEEALLRGRLSVTREVVDAFISLLSRFPDTELSEDLWRLFEERIRLEKEPLGVFQLLKLIALLNPERARRLAGELKESGKEVLVAGAEEFLAA